MRAEHVPGALEPLLWISDIVAGAVRAQRRVTAATPTCWAIR